MSGLEEVGVPGPEHLREALTNCTDPLAAIEEFQLQNGILLPSLRPALPFLDLHGIMRHDFHQSVTEELRDRLLLRIREIAASQDKNKYKLLNELLTKCIAVIRVKALRPVVMCILQHLPKIKHEHLLLVIQDRELYLEAPVEVKQQIWQDNQALFGDEVSPLLSRYIDLKESILFSLDSSAALFFTTPPKSRRQADVVQQLARMIGRNIRLYDMVLQFLRTLFMRTRNVHYCTLRAELLMVLHDTDVQEIVTADPCHKFTWCLDACIRDRLIDSKRIRELHGFIETIGGYNQQQVLGDLAMILCDCQAVQVLSATVMKCLQHCAATESLPRSNEELMFALRMLSLGLGAWQIIDSQVFTEPKLEPGILTRLLPALLTLSVDDQMNSAMLAAGNKDFTDKAADTVPKVLLRTGSRADDAVWSVLLVQYALCVARGVCSNAQQQGSGSSAVFMPSGVSSLQRLLLLLASYCDVDVVFNDLSLHELASCLATAPVCDAFTSQQFTETVVDKFFLPMISRENVCRHLLRLLFFVHHLLQPATLDRIKAAIQRSKQSEAVRVLLQSVVDKINATQSSSAPVAPAIPAAPTDKPTANPADVMMMSPV